MENEMTQRENNGRRGGRSKRGRRDERRPRETGGSQAEQKLRNAPSPFVIGVDALHGWRRGDEPYFANEKRMMMAPLRALVVLVGTKFVRGGPHAMRRVAEIGCQVKLEFFPQDDRVPYPDTAWMEMRKANDDAAATELLMWAHRAGVCVLDLVPTDDIQRFRFESDAEAAARILDALKPEFVSAAAAMMASAGIELPAPEPAPEADGEGEDLEPPVNLDAARAALEGNS